MNNTPYILYLEDDAIELMKFKLVMQKLNSELRIKSLENGEEGLNFLLENINNLPLIIILDLKMPKMNGFEFLEIVKNHISLKKTPIIVLTSSNDKNDILFTYDHQVAGYFVKPFDTKEYEKIIERINEYWQISKIP